MRWRQIWGHLQTKERQGLPVTPRARREAWITFFPSLWEQGPAETLIADL